MFQVVGDRFSRRCRVGTCIGRGWGGKVRQSRPAPRESRAASYCRLISLPLVTASSPREDFLKRLQFDLTYRF